MNTKWRLEVLKVNKEVQLRNDPLSTVRASETLSSNERFTTLPGTLSPVLSDRSMGMRRIEKAGLMV